MVSKYEDETFRRIDSNLNTKEVRIRKKDRNEANCTSARITNIHLGSIIDLSNDGLRWESPCLNQSPSGYRSFYNSLNELIYRGVIIRDMKECFGSDFYPSLSQWDTNNIT